MTTPASARFFVALLPPQAVQDQIIAIQHEIWQRFGSKAALRSPPHITLQPPFLWPTERLGDLKQPLATFAQAHPPVPIELAGFNAFAPRVIYVDVHPSPRLMALQPALMAHLAATCALSDPVSLTRPFRPHITVGFRDLSPAAFGLAWPEFEHRPFAAQFVVPCLTLLRHDGQVWQIGADFPFGSPNP
ncbi:MAG TPA: 2'-5' RNA ligase family protein [Nodosilinea sp.]|nr:2'-5' RNA ligase family protein [Nodosilinea sp.]